MFAQISIAKKLAWLLASVFALLMLLAPPASAQINNHDLCSGADLTFGDDTAPCQITEKDANGHDVSVNAESKANKLIASIVNIASVVVGVLAVLMVIYGGFRFVTSAGNPESTKAAKNAILYAIIGLLIVAFAQIIVKFVLAKVTGQENTSS